MSTPQRIVVVGGGLAGAKTVEELRTQGYAGELTLVHREAHLPYERPPLSKDYLQGKAQFDDALVHPQSWYDEHDVHLVEGVATAIDLDAHEVQVEGGATLGYDRLVLATGSTPRRLPIDGADAEGVLTLRTKEDSDAIRATFGSDKRLVIVGGGWIGLEVAAAARAKGTAVTVLEAGELPLLAVLGPEIAQVFADLHTEQGVDLRTGAQVAAIEVEDGRATGVRMGDGSVIAADAVLLGVGAAPNVDLAQSAGLDVDNGVLVDASLRSSNPDVYVVGDIANHDHPVLGRRLRVEHWATALNQPSAVAASLVGGDKPYTELPYFYTDQYDLGMEYIGNAGKDAYDRVVVRGDLDSREFVSFWLDDQSRILAAMNVNVWDVVDQIKPLIADSTVVDADKLADPSVDYPYVARTDD